MIQEEFAKEDAAAFLASAKAKAHEALQVALLGGVQDDSSDEEEVGLRVPLVTPVKNSNSSIFL